MSRKVSDVEDEHEFAIGGDSAVRAVVDVAETDDGDVPTPAYDEKKLTDLRYVLQPTRLRLLQQILATDWGSLSPMELAFRNPDTSESTIRDHLREMTERERPITAKLTVPEGERRQGTPRTFYAVTEYGVELLQLVGAYEGISLLYQLYENVDRPDEIHAVEEFDYRPEPDWL